MENELIEALNEMESESFTNLEEARKYYSKSEIMDIWLRYEGIQGYTDRIIEAMGIIN